MKYIFILLSLLSNLAFAQTPVELLQNKLNALKSMSASFNQVVKVKNRALSQSNGTMALQRPGKFRWQTQSPIEQLVVADGNSIWIYDKDLEQVTVKKQSKSLGGTAALFLSGYDDSVAKDFEVSQTNQDSTLIFDLKSKSTRTNFQRIKLFFNKEELKGLDLYDQLGQITTVTFNQIKSSPKLPNTTFTFTPPKGVDVVRQ